MCGQEFLRTREDITDECCDRADRRLSSRAIDCPVGTKTASGIPLDDNAMTAAHKSLPFGSKVKVTNKKSGDAVTVTITDRGPYVKGRCIDLSKAGASALGFAGLVPVSVVPVVSD
jgi:rare lipoprotein A